MAGSGARSSEPPPGGDGQGDLFGGVPALPASAPRRRAPDARVGAAAADPELATLAARLPAGLRFGTSSWGFAGWAGLVYDRAHPGPQIARQGLEAYSGHPLLRAVGVDRGFYAPVPESDLRRYAAVVPADFRFLLKAHAALTTVPGPSPPPYLAGVPPAFLDVEHAQRAVLQPAARALGGRLGACAHPRMPPVATQFGPRPRAIRGPLVVRWLLHPGATYEAARRRYAPFDRLVDPDPNVRGEIATAALDALESGREALIIVNNKAEGSAPLGIVALARHMASQRGAS